jgi:AcrR family transcriptional regulator
MLRKRAGPPETTSETLTSRRRSAASIETDGRLLESALDEMTDVGVDRLGMIGVARHVGLTTGALYGRYENVNELAADIWRSRVSEAFFAFLDDVVLALLDGDAKARAHVLEILAAPPREIIAGLELMVCARRVDELEEVVRPDVDAWMKRRGALPRARDKRRRAQVLFAIGAVAGILLHGIPNPREIDWERELVRIMWSFGRGYAAPSDRFVPEKTGAVRAAQGEPHQDALIDAVAAITTRVGFERATASRIARRANLTSGAIYARYQTKDDLLTDAVEVLLAKRFSDDLAANTYLFNAPDVGIATARVVGGYLGTARRDWRIFRIEAQLASRYRPALAATLDRVQERAIRAYLEALGATTEHEFRALDTIARVAQVLPLGLAFVDIVAPGAAATDWRTVFVPLLSPEAP